MKKDLQKRSDEVILDAGLYERLSNEKQVRGDLNSIDAQDARCRERAKAEGFNCHTVYVDRGWSGRKSKRPEWQRMHEDIESGRIKAVIAYKLERCARDTAEGIRFIDLCIEHNCLLISVSENIDIYSPLGRKNAIDLLSCAEYESRNTGAKVSYNREIYAQQGYKNGGKYPPGFRKSSTPRIPEHDPVPAEWMLEVFEKAAAKNPLLEIEKDLSQRKIKTPEYEVTKRGGEKEIWGGNPIRVDQLKQWIRNPMYKGYVEETHHKPGQKDTHTYVKGLFEPLVSEELWAAANKALNDAEKSTSPRIQQKDQWFHPLKGIMACGVCGSMMTPRPSGKKAPSGKPYLFYRCNGTPKSRKACDTPVKQLPAGLIEDLIYDYLGKMADHPQVIDALVGASQRGKTNKIRKLGTEIKHLNKQLNEIKEKIDNLTEVAAKIGIKGFSEDSENRIKKLHLNKEKILAQIHRSKREQEALKDEKDYRIKIQEGLKHFAAAARTLSEDEQRELVQRVIDGITVNPDPLSKNGEILNSGQRILIEIRLRMGSLVKVDTQRGRKLTVKLDVTLQRGKALWATATGDVPLEIRKPEPGRSKKKPSPEARKHEIHRADHILKTMEKRGWSAAEYARSEGITRSAVSQVMRWYKLSSECQEYLRTLTDPKLVRACSHRLLRQLEKHPPVEQLSVLIAATKKKPENR